MRGGAAISSLYYGARERYIPASYRVSSSQRIGRIVSTDFTTSKPHVLLLPDGLSPTKPFVSAAQVDRDHLAIVDYSNLYCLHISTNRVTLVRRPFGLPGSWVPTGLAFSKGRLYVANYTGNNVIEGAVDCASGSMRVTAIVASADLISPENVAVNERGNVLVSANYDGNNVAAFSRGPTGWKPLWTAKNIGLAHGVAIIGKHVYATSLNDKKIFRLDLESGRQLSSRGSRGPDPSKNQYLWPTGLLNYKGRLVLTDAHTGYVCSIKPDSLETDICFGGYRGGQSGLNMPYGLSMLNNNLLIIATFSSRILEVVPDFAAGRIGARRDWYSSDAQRVNPHFLDNEDLFATRIIPFRDNPYSSRCVMPLWLSSHTCAYNGIVSSKGKFLRFPDSGSILSSSNYYFVQSFSGSDPDDFYYFSPQNPTILNVRFVKGVPYMFSLVLDRNYLGFDQRGPLLVSPVSTLKKSDIIAQFSQLRTKLDLARDANGVVRFGMYSLALRTAIDAKTSVPGRKFVDCYAAYASDSSACDAPRLRKFAISFALEELSKGSSLLDRALIPCMLSNAQCGTVIKNALRD